MLARTKASQGPQGPKILLCLGLKSRAMGGSRAWPARCVICSLRLAPSGSGKASAHSVAGDCNIWDGGDVLTFKTVLEWITDNP